MRKLCTRILTLTLCLCLCGCTVEEPAAQTGNTTLPSQTQQQTQPGTTVPNQPSVGSTQPAAVPTEPAETQPTQPAQTEPIQQQPTDPRPTETQPTEPEPTQPDSSTPVLPTVPEEEKNVLPLGNSGAARITYTVNVSSVRYITSAAQLPDYPELAGYDNAYFETGALIVVLESVNSSSVQVDIESVELTDSKALVTLSHEGAGDVSVPAMATWLVWTEVEKGLSYTWEVVNPALTPNVQDR